MRLRRSIGALAVIDNDDPVAILQVRDTADSYPGCLQLTIHGGVEGSETLKAALSRETQEEIRELFHRAALSPPDDLIEDVEASIHDLRIVHRIRTSKQQVVSLSAKVDPRITADLQPLRERDIIRFITRRDLYDIRVLNTDDPEQKRNGLGSSISAMFEDELRVVEIALANPSSKQHNP